MDYYAIWGVFVSNLAVLERNFEEFWRPTLSECLDSAFKKGVFTAVIPQAEY